MKIIYYLFLFLIGMMKGQTYRFIYEVNSKKDSTENIMTKEYFHLDINQDEILYYGRDFFISDSIKKLNLPHGFPAPKLNDFFVHKTGSKTYDGYEFLGWDIIKRNSQPEQRWELLPEKKEFQNFSLQKATTVFGGRSWTAWFTSEIPFQEGPHKFYGLPGLIVELSDDKGNFKFKLVKSQYYKVTNQIDLLSRMFKKNLYLDDKSYLKYKLTHYEDPFAYLKNGRVDWSETEEILLDNGTRLTKENIRSSTDIQRRLIKKYNNPVELDNIIHYPK
ncbi:GLPGLI family protein [Chryseobacterium defluvii]|uniref:GLPGLI family protein n=1 Tax=Chryseobacterium defluvii TaxID=160396 RepID=A0A840KC30_9FLAO|nr:GLPGLI family protein [Chryseobacterium defluvii]MBB4805344.1 GLPGLI family protein [Chryseobacterium defluvii]